MDPLRDQEDIKLLAAETAKYVDGRWLAGDPILPGAAGTAYARWADAQSKMSVRDFGHGENRFELIIGTDPGTGRLMVIAFTENQALLDAFKTLPEVEEYGYWDNTDSYPEGVTEADWKVREAAWDWMLPGLGRHSDTMETWILRDTVEIRDELRSDTVRLLAPAPSPAERATFPGKDAYADCLRQDRGVEVMNAVRFVVFGRGASVQPPRGVHKDVQALGKGSHRLDRGPQALRLEEDRRRNPRFARGTLAINKLLEFTMSALTLDWLQ